MRFGAICGPDTLTTFGFVRLGRIGNGRGEGGDIDVRVAERLKRRADVGRGDGRQIALHVDDDFDLAFRIERFQRLINAVGSRNMIAARHDGASAGFFHGGCNGF